MRVLGGVDANRFPHGLFSASFLSSSISLFRQKDFLRDIQRDLACGHSAHILSCEETRCSRGADHEGVGNQPANAGIVPLPAVFDTSGGMGGGPGGVG